MRKLVEARDVWRSGLCILCVLLFLVVGVLVGSLPSLKERLNQLFDSKKRNKIALIANTNKSTIPSAWRIYEDSEYPEVYLKYPEGGGIKKEVTKDSADKFVIRWYLTLGAPDYKVNMTFEKRELGPRMIRHNNPDYCILAGNDFWGIVRFLEVQNSNSKTYLYGYKYNGYYYDNILKPKGINITAEIQGPNFKTAEEILAEVIKSFISHNYPTMKILDYPKAARAFIVKLEDKEDKYVFIRPSPVECGSKAKLVKIAPTSELSIPSYYKLENIMISPLEDVLLFSYRGKEKGWWVSRIYSFDMRLKKFFPCGKSKFVSGPSPASLGWDSATRFFLLQDDGISYRGCNIRTHRPFYEDHKYATENTPWN